ncbi:MAG: methyltransferase domain-containing protein [Myxococcota bacterium]
MSTGQDPYARQHRGDAAAYQAYFAGMDASMQQKVALTTAHFPPRGRIADMGSGSGRGTYDLASLYPALELVGVDINPVSVRAAQERYQRPNLSYVVGDIADPVFPPESLDGILDSSVLHHVTSFNGFSLARLEQCLDNQAAALKPGGIIIIRDFVIPHGPELVHLDVSVVDGADTGPVEQLSTAALLERFAAEFRCSVNRDGPVPCTRLPSPHPGCARFQLTLRAAQEFILRKDYRADWAAELLEEYTYFTQAQFEDAFRRRGLRIVTATPIRNPWIVANRYLGRVHLHALDGTPLPFPPTNFLVVGEKVRAGQGVALVEKQSAALTEPRFLRLHSYRHKEQDQRLDLVERPGRTVDVLPWFEREGQLLVVAKKGFPRPVVNACADHPNLGGAGVSGYITEPIAAILPDDTPPHEGIRHVLRERAGIAADDVISSTGPITYFTSPGGVDECVSAYLVNVREGGAGQVRDYVPFSEVGTVRELDALQVLRACQVGGMFDARLELNIYQLLRRRGRSAGPWIGATISPTEQSGTLPHSPEALRPPAHGAFELVAGASGFLDVRQGIFEERDARGGVLVEVPREYVLPKQLTRNTVVALPVVRTSSGIHVGVEHRDLPAVQRATGSSSMAVAPAWRLPHDVTDLGALPAFMARRMRVQFGAGVLRSWELGGAYLPTPGVTPEVVHPYAVEVALDAHTARALRWLSLDAFLAGLDDVHDAHLLTAGCRLAHALGKL